MKIRTAEQLFDHIAADLIWRKKEISTLRWLLSQATADKRGPLLRSTVALVYAHWEGFVKLTGSAYLEFVHYRGLKHRELAPHFMALAARSLLRRAGSSNSASAHLEVATFFTSRLDEKGELPFRSAVDTGSNLSSVVLREIIDTLGLDFAPFETKSQLIDERLLRSRNTIAHGEYMVVDETHVDELATEVIQMLEAFRSQVDNAVAMKAYKAKAP